MDYKIYRETEEMNNKTDEQLQAETRRNPASRIEYAKRRHGLYGDVYFITPYNIIADADSHLAACPNSAATDIEDMAIERIAQIEAERAAES